MNEERRVLGLMHYVGTLMTVFAMSEGTWTRQSNMAAIHNLCVMPTLSYRILRIEPTDSPGYRKNIGSDQLN